MLSFLQLDQLSCRPSASIQNALNEVAKLIKDFDADMRRHIGGVPYKEGIVQQIRIPCDRFRRDIRRTAPEIRPFEEPEPGRKKTLAAPEFLKHEEEEGRKGEGEDKDEDGLIYVNEVYQRMQESRSRELPGHFPYVVQREYIKDVMIKWESPATRLCEEVYAILTELMKKLVYKHFATFGQGMLEHQIQLIMHEHLTHCLHVAKQGVNWLMKIQDDPFTLNNHYMSDYKDKFLRYYRQVRQDSLTKDEDLGAVSAGPTKSLSGALGIAEHSDYATEVLSGLSKLGFQGLMVEDLAKLFAKDEMEPALEIMATVGGYFQVAYKRFVDNVPMAIDYELVKGGEQDVFQLLWTRLGLDSPKAYQMCDEYAQEASQAADRREELNKKLEKLSQATCRLLSVNVQ